MSHYFDENPNLKHNRKELSFRFSGLNYTFISDSGVFCKNNIDAGTEVLLVQVVNDVVGKKVLDLGCGYGVVGIIINKIFEGEVDMVDINNRAIECSISNAQRNNVAVNIYQSNGFEKVTSSYDTIILNPPIRAGKEVIYKLFEDSYKYLNQDGKLWIVIRKQHGASSAQKKLNEIFDEVKLVKKDLGYYVYCAIKHEDKTN